MAWREWSGVHSTPKVIAAAGIPSKVSTSYAYLHRKNLDRHGRVEDGVSMANLSHEKSLEPGEPLIWSGAVPPFGRRIIDANFSLDNLAVNSYGGDARDREAISDSRFLAKTLHVFAAEGIPRGLETTLRVLVA